MHRFLPKRACVLAKKKQEQVLRGEVEPDPEPQPPTIGVNDRRWQYTVADRLIAIF
jgi:hypothetical protein